MKKNFFYSHFLLTLKPKSNETAQKIEKFFFINVFYNPILHLSPVWAALFGQKQPKSLYPNVHCTYKCMSEEKIEEINNMLLSMGMGVYMVHFIANFIYYQYWAYLKFVDNFCSCVVTYIFLKDRDVGGNLEFRIKRYLYQL